MTKTCRYCDEGCEWKEFGKTLNERSKKRFIVYVDCVVDKKSRKNVDNGKVRKEMYRDYIKLKLGVLGKGNRKVIPDFIVDHIKNIFPDINGKYM